MSDRGRRAPRFDAELHVDVGVFETESTCSTTNVSRFGVHVDGEVAAPGELVWVRLLLPDRHIVECTMQARRHPPKGGTGLAFSVFVHGTRRYWERYITELESGERVEGEERRVFRRAMVSVVVQVGGKDGAESTTKDLSPSGVFVATDAPLAVGSLAELVLVEPESEAHIVVQAKVVRREKGGVAFEFVELDPPAQAHLRRFLEGDA
jgi:hypothetical protein